MTIDTMSFQERVVYGKAKEDQIRKCLNENYEGFNLQAATFSEDCEDKTDCWQVEGEEKRRVAIKVRATKQDILACLWEPFWGTMDKRTKRGRDMLTEYAWYITLSPDEKTIRVALGSVLHKIYNEMWGEWLAKVGDMCDHIKSEQLYKKKILASVKHPDCELWLHRDRKNNRPKVLGFIPPSYLKEGEEINYYPFLVKNEN
jgi:hypothetical protein